MTREEAIEEVKSYDNYPNGLSKECRDYIIKALEQELTIKNNLGVDCVSRREVDRLVWKYLRKETDDNIAFYEHFLELPSVTPQEHVKKLEEQIKQLQNRCHAFTHGQICVFCLYDCEHKAESEE